MLHVLLLLRQAATALGLAVVVMVGTWAVEGRSMVDPSLSSIASLAGAGTEALGKVATRQAQLLSAIAHGNEESRLELHELTSALERLAGSDGDRTARVTTPAGSTFWFRGATQFYNHNRLQMVSPAVVGGKLTSDTDGVVLVAGTDKGDIQFITGTGRELPLCAPPVSRGGNIVAREKQFSTSGKGVRRFAAQGTKTDATLAVVGHGQLQAWSVLLGSSSDGGQPCVKLRLKWERGFEPFTGGDNRSCEVEMWGTRLKPAIAVSCQRREDAASDGQDDPRVAQWNVHVFERSSGKPLFEFPMWGSEQPAFDSRFGTTIVTQNSKIRMIKLDKKQQGPFLCDFGWPESARITAAMIDGETARVIIVGTADGRLLRLGVPQKFAGDCKVLQEWKIGGHKKEIAAIYALFRHTAILLLRGHAEGEGDTTGDLALVDLEVPEYPAIARMPHAPTVPGKALAFVSPGRNGQRVAVAYRDGQTALYDAQISRRRIPPGHDPMRGMFQRHPSEPSSLFSALNPILLVALGIGGFLIIRSKRELAAKGAELAAAWPRDEFSAVGLTRRRALRTAQTEARRRRRRPGLNWLEDDEGGDGSATPKQQRKCSTAAAHDLHARTPPVAPPALAADGNSAVALLTPAGASTEKCISEEEEDMERIPDETDETNTITTKPINLSTGDSSTKFTTADP